MTWPFENDTSAITKKIAKNDIDKNRVKKVFSLTTIVFATALLMMLVMFESGYETTKDRMAEGQPQVVFYDLSQQQIELLYWEENIESIKVTETENGYDASITIVDATKMTQYGFSSAVDNISSKYDIHHVTRNDLFMDSLPNGGLLNQKNMVLMGVAIFIIIVSALVIYNVFYLSVVNQVRQFGQLRTVGMTQQQTKKIMRYERKFLCRIGVPIGLLIGGLAGYLLQPDGWDWIAAVVWGIIISVIINFVVKVSLNRPTKIALSISPILSSKYMMERFDCKVTNKEKRKLSSLGLAIISITSHWKSILVSVLSLGLSGLLFVLAATYTASIDPESIVKKDVYQYGQFVIDTTGKYSEKVSEIENFKQKIMELPNISNIKQVVETDISWAGKNSTGKDQLSIITDNDFASIQQFRESGDLDYQQLVQSNQIVAVNGVEGISKGDTVEFTFGDGTQKTYTVGGVLDGDLYSNTAIYGGWFLMPAELITENSASFDVSIRLIVKANDTGLEHTIISLEKVVDMSDGLTLTTMQEAIASKEATIRQVGISIIGVTLFLLLFSIITFASTIITNIATKKREYAMLQSIGMTWKQTGKMALCESCVLAVGSLILTLILGIILGQILIKGLISAGIFYLSYTFPLTLFTVYCIVVVLIILTITISAFYSLQKTPLVERLRIVD